MTTRERPRPCGTGRCGRRPGRPDARLEPLTDDGLFGLVGNQRVRVKFPAGRMELNFRDTAHGQVYRRL